MKKLLVSIVLTTLLLASCGGDDLADCTASSFNERINTEISALNNAITAFNGDNSEANCNAVKDAAQSYLDAVEDFDGCAGITQADYDQSLTAAREAVNAINC